MVVIGSIIWLQKLPWQLKYVWGYFAVITALHTFWPYYYPEFAPSLSNALAWNAALVLCMMLAMPLLILNASEKYKDRILIWLKWYMVYDAIILLLGGSGVFSATTFDASIMACFILYWDPTKKFKIKSFNIYYEAIAILITLAAIVFVKGRDAGLILAVIFAVRILQWIHKRMTRFAFVASYVSIYLIGLGGLVLYWPHLIKDARFEMWQGFFFWWDRNVNAKWGTGLGSFEWIGLWLDPGDQLRNKGVGFYVMHNDWLQLLFEGGFIGLLIGLFGYAYTAFKLQGKAFATWLGIGAGMVFYYISHAWVIHILALTLIAKTKSDDTVREDS